MSREQIIRDTAYAIWEAEGKPHGRAAQHWQQAEERVAASMTGGAKPSAKGKVAASVKSVSAEAKPPAKAAAKDATGTKTGEVKSAVKQAATSKGAGAKSASDKGAAAKSAGTTAKADAAAAGKPSAPDKSSATKKKKKD